MLVISPEKPFTVFIVLHIDPQSENEGDDLGLQKLSLYLLF
jgi:hypothetical protein